MVPQRRSVRSRPVLRDILGGRFRAHRAYELVAQERLSRERRDALRGLEQDPDHYGLLVPRATPELGVMAVGTESARLFRSLEEPGPLPASLVAPGSGSNSRIARLVLDGILETERNGRFVTGPRAAGDLFAGDLFAGDLFAGELHAGELAGPRPEGRIAALSYAAIRRAGAVPIDKPDRLSSWLYSYNTLPASPAWTSRLGAERLEETLGLEPGGALRRQLDDAYASHELPCWRSWRRLEDGRGASAERPAYKLYLSPHPRALGEAFRAAVRVLVAGRVPAFKLGKDVHGLLRSDKMVAYFNDPDALRASAEALAKALAGCPAQGVPFSAALSDDGLLSWGMDPPVSEGIPGWSGVESWRIWVTNRLARNLLRARRLGSGELEPWRYALLRLALEGVDPRGFLPDPEIWQEDEVPS